MNIVKAVVILVVGILIGYQLPSSSNKAEISLAGNKQPLALAAPDKQESQPALATESERCSMYESKSPDKERESTKEIASLTTANSELEQKYRKLKQEYFESQHNVSMLKRLVGELDESNISDEQISALVPEAYQNIVVNFRGQTRDEIFDFHQQAEDLDKGYDLSVNISSFITSHAYSFGVELNSIICKESYCELLVKEKERPSWDRIFQDMIKQDWWQFNSTNSSSTTDANDNILIYNFMSIQS